MDKVKGQGVTKPQKAADIPPNEANQMPKGGSDLKCKAGHSAGDNFKMPGNYQKGTEFRKQRLEQTKISRQSVTSTPQNSGDTPQVLDLNRHYRGHSGRPVCSKHSQNLSLRMSKNPEKIPHINVNPPTLTFKKHFNFNHPVYGAQIYIENCGPGHIVFKVFPSNPEKLCMEERQGIIGPGDTVLVTMATCSKTPYKYMDILEETVELVFASVDLLEATTGGAGRTGSPLVQETCKCMWNKLESLDTFWKMHQPGSDERVIVKRFDVFVPFDLAYLTEKSSMESQWPPILIMKALVSPASWGFVGRGVTHLVSCDFDSELRMLWTLVQCLFPNCLSLERTQWLASPPKRTPLDMKRKILKFLILGFILLFFVGIPPVLPAIRTWMHFNKN